MDVVTDQDHREIQSLNSSKEATPPGDMLGKFIRIVYRRILKHSRHSCRTQVVTKEGEGSVRGACDAAGDYQRACPI